ncbi:MAG: PilZ domain-containing protein [Pseudomonadota bacterium]
MTVQEQNFVANEAHDVARQHLGDRRNAVRHRAVLQQARHVGQYSQQLCIVKNISRSGMMARTFAPLQKREKQLIEFRGGKSVLGRIAWTKDDCAGFEFAEKIDPDTIFQPPVPSIVPRTPRLEVDIIARLETEHVMIMAPVLDISQTGAKIECPEIARTSGPVPIHFENLARLPAIVRWAGDGRMGLCFTDKIPLATLAKWAVEKRPRRSLTDYCLNQIPLPSAADLDEDWQQLLYQIDAPTQTHYDS